MSARDDHFRGLSITLLGVLFFTPDALLLRLIGADTLTIAALRGLIAGLVVLAASAFWHGPRFFGVFRGLGREGLAVMTLEATCMILFVAAIGHTTAANVLIIFAASPMLAALLSRFVLGEPVAPATWAAIAAVTLGILIVAGGSLDGGHWLGNLFALGNALGVAFFYIVVRRAKSRDLVPAVGCGYLLGAAVAAPFAAFPPMDGGQWLCLVLNGGIVLPGAMICFAIGPRYLPAPEVSMLALLEVIVGPLLVWWVIGEDPGPASLIGGAIVVAALFAHAAWRLRRGETEPEAEAAPAQ